MEPLKGGQFGPALKRWFASNNWPQSITQDWANAAQSPNGPWASQISKAMNGKAEPKPEFFMALAAFNEAVCERKVQGFTDRRLVDRMISGEPICHENGVPYDAPAFFSLYVGLIEPPEFAEPEPEITITQEDVDLWHQTIRGMFKEIAIKYMLDRPAAWEMVQAKIVEQAHGNNNHDGNDDLMWCKEILSGFRDATIEECVRLAQRWGKKQPLMTAMGALLGKTPSPLVKEAVGRASQSSAPLPSFADGMGFRGSVSTRLGRNYMCAIAHA